jgi:hypothetical protein
MPKFQGRCRAFGRGLYCGGIGAGVGLIVFFVAYLWTFRSRGHLTAMHWFSPGFSIVPVATSFAFVTTAGVLSRQAVSHLRIVVYSCLGSFVGLLLAPATSMGWTTRKMRLMENPLFEMEHVWFIFAANVLAIALGSAFAPTRVMPPQTIYEIESRSR